MANQTAQTIIDQLGGAGRICAMTGADRLVTSKTALKFKTPASDDVDAVEVAFDRGRDTYTVTTYEICSVGGWHDQRTIDRVYAAKLRDVIEDAANIALRL